MRILFVSSHFYPNLKSGGAYNRMLMFIDAFNKVDHLDILFFVSPDDKKTEVEILEIEKKFQKNWHPGIKLFLCEQRRDGKSKWQEKIKGIFSFYEQKLFSRTCGKEQLCEFENCLSKQPDFIFAHTLSSMGPALLTKKSLPPILFDLDGVKHKQLIRSIRQRSKKLFLSPSYLQIPALIYGEISAIKLADSSFVCSTLDKEYLSKKWNLSRVKAIQNGITIPREQILTKELNILFLGTYSYPPNINTAEFLIEKIWPKVHAKIPEAKLIIAGGKPQKIPSYQKKPEGVEFTGYVDELETLYQRARIICCPMFEGGGTRVKLIEAAAFGKAIISSRIGAEGLNLVDKKEYLECNNITSFVNACINLLKDYSFCEELGAAARRKAIHDFDRSKIVSQIRELTFHS